MKKIFNLTVAALALITLASCSNDDFFSSSKEVSKKDMVNIENVEVPVEQSLTRAAYAATPMGTPIWQDGDMLNVYDADLYKHDKYEFDGDNGAFVLTTSGNVTDNQYAIYPSAEVDRTSWSEGDVITARMQIPSTFTYDADTEVAHGDGLIYVSDLPMWGVASNDDEYGVNVEQLSYLTGILRVTIPNVLGNTSFLKIESASKPLSGYFEATLDKENTSSVVLAPTENGNETKNYIIVDLTGIPSDKSVIYLPIIAGDYPAGDLKISHYLDAASAYDLDAVVADVESATPAITWSAVKNWVDGTTFTRASVKGVTIPTSAFGLNAANPVQVNAALDQYKTASSVNLNTAAFTVASDVATTGNVIKIPNMAADKVYLTISGAPTLTTNDLTIQDDDVDDPFTGTFIVTLPAAAAATNVTINLAQGNVVLAGAATNGWTPTVTSVNSLAIGDGETATKSAGFIPTKISSSLLIAKKASVSSAITLPAATTTAFAFDIEGQITGNVDSKAATVTMTGLGLATGDTPAKITGDLTAAGNVNINLTSEGEAITGTLTMLASNKTLKVTNGYIAALVSNVTGLAMADTKKLTVDFDDANGLTAIGAVTDATGVITFTESTWSGKTPAALTAATYVTGKTIYTAAQLNAHNGETAAAALDLVLGNDIDYSGKQWNGIAGGTNTVSLDGTKSDTENYTISNIDFFADAVTADKDFGSVGFFATCKGTTAGKAIKNVNFTGVKGNFASFEADPATAADVIKKTFTNLGVLVGSSTAPLNISNVNVEISGNFGAAAYTATATKTNCVTNVGGLVGSTVGATIASASVTATKIQGYGTIGGLIGSNGVGNIAVTKSATSVGAYAITFSSPDLADLTYAQVGSVLGKQAGTFAAANTFSIDADTYADGNTLSLPASAKTYYSKVEGNVTNIYDFKHDAVNVLGYSGEENTVFATATVGNITVNGKVAEIIPYNTVYATWKTTAANANKLALYYFLKRTE